jgi:hypothetical protein
MFAGREVVTVEGLGRRRRRAASRAGRDGRALRLAVRLLHAGLRRVDVRGLLPRRLQGAPWQISDQLCGNLCRCTGYRPIRDARWTALALSARAAGRARRPFAERLQKAPVASAGRLDYAAAADRFFRPDVAGRAVCAAKHRSIPAAQLVAGATEIGVELNKKFKAFPLLDLDRGRAGADAHHVDDRRAGGSARRPR